jgi:hypothetical protein
MSVYLNVDQSLPANLNRGFEIHLNDLIGAQEETITEPAELERFKKASRRIQDFVSTWTVEGKSLVLFFDTSDDFFWTRELRVSLDNQCRWGRDLLLQPLEAALDEGEAYVVALTGYSTLRLFAVSMGAVEEFVETAFDHRDVRHLRTVGTDHLGQSNNVQSKADENIRRNLRQIVSEIDSLMQTRAINRLILAGTPKITSELKAMLPKRVFMKVIGATQIGTDASIPEVLAASNAVAEQFERGAERRAVLDLVTTANKTQRAVTGLPSTLKAVNDNRVWQLIYAEGLGARGFECPACSALYALESRSCPICGSALTRVDNVVERAIEYAFRRGAAIEAVKGDPAEELKDSGGIGALLKARTARA